MLSIVADLFLIELTFRKSQSELYNRLKKEDFKLVDYSLGDCLTDYGAIQIIRKTLFHNFLIPFPHATFEKELERNCFLILILQNHDFFTS